MKNTICKFDARNSTTVRDGNATCDKCGEGPLDATYGILNRIGDDVDCFEFEARIWSICRECVNVYMESRPEDFILRIR